MNFKPLNISAEFVCRIVFYFGRWNRLISTLDCHLCCNFVVIIQWPCVLRSVWLMMVEMHTALQLLVHQIPSPPFDRRGYENTMEAHGCWRNGMKNPLLFKIRALFLSFIHPQPPPSAFLHAPSQPSLFQITLREQEPVKGAQLRCGMGGREKCCTFLSGIRERAFVRESSTSSKEAHDWTTTLIGSSSFRQRSFFCRRITYLNTHIDISW